jgi:hypothetical protein
VHLKALDDLLHGTAFSQKLQDAKPLGCRSRGGLLRGSSQLSPVGLGLELVAKLLEP